MSSEDILKNCNSKIKKTYDVFVQDLTALRTGRANAAMLDIIKVEVYGQSMPINQLATISTPDPRSINVQVWDQNNVSLIDSAIKKSNLGINPQIDGQLLRIPIPNLNEERRTELKKIMGTQADSGTKGYALCDGTSNGSGGQRGKGSGANLSDKFHLGGFSTGSSFQDAKTEDAFDQISNAFLSLFIGGVNNE